MLSGRVANSTVLLVSQIPGFDFAYGYRPSLAFDIVFRVLFGIAFFGHAFQAVRMRRWSSVLLSLCALIELVGWAGRTWSAECPTLTISPVFFMAVLYVILGSFIIILGRKYSLILAELYINVFLLSIGGAMASTTASGHESPQTGTNIMIITELAQGRTGYLILHEWYLVSLDGAPVAVAVSVFLPFGLARTFPKSTRVIETVSGDLSDTSTNVV
ncbi:RTA1-domain-containing protein [Durotheca rogersii]|uniref:RTA1-domain-containing protein n=1 Tax=Durotheca rogersii TaxID=419775 RepID=UPI00221F0D8D|nr:RTA1-domain-containing protein [Durotheca rogersii]KAI5857349.1 RTA1-domain-containing protein [Durotheca rogersii]